MQITEVKIQLKDDVDKRLKAYATVTFDDSFVVRNIKIIEGRQGLFIAMPSRRIRVSCPNCHARNEISNKYCAQCGKELPPQPEKTPEQIQSEHKDIAHPIRQDFRQYMQQEIISAYEKARSEAGSSAAEESA